MFEYRFIKVPLEYEAISTEMVPSADYRQIVSDHARDGWKLLQVLVPPVGGGTGYAKYFEFIFERAKQERAVETISEACTAPPCALHFAGLIGRPRVHENA